MINMIYTNLLKNNYKIFWAPDSGYWVCGTGRYVFLTGGLGNSIRPYLLNEVTNDPDKLDT
jgi:hypothetical protein